MRPGSAGERGYTLLALIGIVTVMLIAVGAAVPHWKALVERGREAELVARGWQYAEAIRVFQKRFGRLPTRLEELVELEPRSIRRLWSDPMTGGPFLLLVEVPDGTLVTVDPATGAVVAPPGGALDENESEEVEGPTAAPQATSDQPSSFGGEGVPVAGPIHGVRSGANGESYRALFDVERYDGWEFTVERLVAATGATGPEGLPRRVDYDSIGKPFRYPPPGGIAGANPNVAPGQPNQPELPEEPAPDEMEPVPEPGDDSGDTGDSGS